MKNALGLSVVLLVNAILTSGQKPWTCAYRTSTICGYYVSNNPFDFDLSNQVCQFYDDSVLASAEVVLNLNTNGKLKWMGFRQNDSTSDWYWIGDQSRRSLNTNITQLFSYPVNIKNNSLSNSSRSSIDNCIAVSGLVRDRKWLIMSCQSLLTETLCQRPLRSKCHRWNFTYGCLWEDERCEHRYEEKSHDSDDELDKCDGQNDENGGHVRYFRRPCAEELCENCKLTVWSQWSQCLFSRGSRNESDQCNTAGVKVRNRSVLVKAKVGKSCNEYSLIGRRNCSITCPLPSPFPRQQNNKTVDHVSIVKVRQQESDAAGDTNYVDNVSQNESKSAHFFDTSKTVDPKKSVPASKSSRKNASQLSISTKSAAFYSTVNNFSILNPRNSSQLYDRTTKNALSETEKSTFSRSSVFQKITSMENLSGSKAPGIEDATISASGQIEKSFSSNSILQIKPSLSPASKTSGITDEEDSLRKENSSQYVYIVLTSIICFLLLIGLSVLLIFWSCCLRRRKEESNKNEEKIQSVYKQSKTRAISIKPLEVTRNVTVDL